MCGILGVYGINNIDSYSFYEALKLQSNRGPDNVETTSLLHAQLGHARLSIHDTSSAANQPMVKDKERYSLIFNGEIYNFRELKKDLGPNYKFETDSDTEVLLFYLIKFGFDETLRKIEGMYAFSFYDSLSGDVYIARDRFGEKPVYYTLNNTSLTVSSSLFSIVSMHGLEGLNLQSVSNYLHYGYCKNEETTAQGINRLKPGGFIKYNVLSHCFIKGDYEQEVPKTQDVDLEVSLKESVRKCLDSDVPVGCFLSGGIDSSLIASYISELSPSVNAYTIGFEDKNYDESDAAEIVATHLGISLKTLVLAESDLVRVIDETNWVFDEPFADASYLAMYELSKFARKDVTVCLSGDGADELFSGYNRHVLIPKIYRKLNLVPYRVRNLLSHLIQNSRLFRRVLHFFYVTVLKESSKVNAFDEKLDKLSVIIGFKDKPDLLFRVLAGKDYSELLGFPKPYRLQIENIEPRTLSKIDLKSYLHEDVLTKVDRCTMANSLEARAPFLNKNIADFAFSAPNDAHFNSRVQKVALRDILSKRIPEEILSRPKSGFSVPYKEIVDNHLKERINNYKNQLRLYPNEFTQCSEIFSLIDSYYKGKFSDYKFVWNSFFFLRWLDNINQLR